MTDLHDFGMKTGDTVRAWHDEQPARVGTIGWAPNRGMTLIWQAGIATVVTPLVKLHELGWKFELLQRPLLNDTQRAIANVLDDPNVHFIFVDSPENTELYPDIVMATVGFKHPVIAVPTFMRAQIEERAKAHDLPVRVYEGPLPQ